jgi:predicted transcriptional regulator
MNKIQLQQRANNRQAIMEVLNTNPAGMLSVEIAKTTGIPVNVVKRLLIALRNKGLIFSKKQQYHTHTWSINDNPTPPPVKNIEVPYPNLDEDHLEWLNQKKPVYDPR